MKTYKKIIFGLCLLIGLSLVSLLTYSHKAAALSKTDFQNATYNFDGSTSISAKLGSAGTVTFVNNNPVPPLVFTPSPLTFNGGQFCSGSKITMTSSVSPNAQIDVKWFNSGSNGSCNSNPPFVGPQTYTGTINITLAGVPPPTNPGSNSGSTCESNFVSPFAWIVCPVLNLTDSIIGAAYGQVENQLCFNTGTNSSTGGIVCKGPNSLVDGVKNSWSIFKNIASALLVIVMLVMVFSQALGGGPFDAYTVRKMLPKLVAAVILMQLSWLLLKFAIDLSNDIGSAIGALMMAPFGGPANMNLADMIGNGVHVATGSSAGQATFDIFATLATVAAFVYAIPALPLLALYVLAGVFIAFFVLVLRKLLIIMLVILAPVALVCWILPGTERYWKLWSENFMKLLAMFPLIMALLTAGRIFAYITSKSGNGATMFNPHLAVAHVGPLPIPYFGSATGFADLAIIIGAFFAPYFLLPKTFNWGGQALGAAGKAVENMTNKASESPKNFLKNREESYRAERRRRSQERISGRRPYGRFSQVFQRPVDSLRSGRIDPTLGLPGSRRREEATRAFRTAGVESSNKEIQAAQEDFYQMAEHVDNHDELARGIASAEIGSTYTYNDRNGNQRSVHVSEAMKQAGMSAIVKYGTDRSLRELGRVVDDLNHGDARDQALAERFRNAEAPNLLSRMNHLYRGSDLVRTGLNDEGHLELRGSLASRADALSAESFASMEAPDLEAMLSGLGAIANARTLEEARHIRGLENVQTPEQLEQVRAQARRRLSSIQDKYRGAMNNATIRGRVGPSVNQAMLAFNGAAGDAGAEEARHDIRVGRVETDIDAHTRPDSGHLLGIERVEGVSDETIAHQITPDGAIVDAPPVQPGQTQQASRPAWERDPYTGGYTIRPTGSNTGGFSGELPVQHDDQNPPQQ